MDAKVLRLVITSAVGLAMLNTAIADTFYVDPDFSFLTVAVYDHTTSTLLTSAQVTDSDTTTLEGTFGATVGGSTITFTDGDVTLDNQGSYMQPSIGGGSASAGSSENPFPASPGSDAANVGLLISVPNDPEDSDAGLLLAGVAALRGIEFTFSSGTISLSSNNFDAGGIPIALSSGSLDYNVNLGDGTALIQSSIDLTGGTAINGSELGGIITSMGVTGIVIPINADIHFNDAGSGLDLDVVLTGQIAGANAAPGAPVPEPSAIALTTSAMVWLALVVRGRKRNIKSLATSPVLAG